MTQAFYQIVIHSLVIVRRIWKTHIKWPKIGKCHKIHRIKENQLIELRSIGLLNSYDTVVRVKIDTFILGLKPFSKLFYKIHRERQTQCFQTAKGLQAVLEFKPGKQFQHVSVRILCYLVGYFYLIGKHYDWHTTTYYIFTYYWDFVVSHIKLHNNTRLTIKNKSFNFHSDRKCVFPNWKKKWHQFIGCWTVMVAQFMVDDVLPFI